VLADAIAVLSAGAEELAQIVDVVDPLLRAVTTSGIPLLLFVRIGGVGLFAFLTTSAKVLLLVTSSFFFFFLP
jgi:hypothetical protein